MRSEEWDAIDWSRYPPAVEALQPFVPTFGVGDDLDRERRIADATDAELHAFVSAVRRAGPVMESFTRVRQSDMPEETALLDVLGEASVEAALELERRRRQRDTE